MWRSVEQKRILQASYDIVLHRSSRCSIRSALRIFSLKAFVSLGTFHLKLKWCVCRPRRRWVRRPLRGCVYRPWPLWRWVRRHTGGTFVGIGGGGFVGLCGGGFIGHTGGTFVGLCGGGFVGHTGGTFVSIGGGAFVQPLWRWVRRPHRWYVCRHRRRCVCRPLWR